jgi:predicted LPLAT superfamily acyltransferase
LNLKNIIAGIQSAVTMAETLVPEIAALTPYGALATTVIKAVSAATEMAGNLQTRIDEGSIVASSTDQAQVRELAQKLHDLNDGLAKQVDDS